MEKRYCKGCQKDVTKSMYCECGEIPLNESSTYSERELEKIEDDLDKIQAKTQKEIDDAIYLELVNRYEAEQEYKDNNPLWEDDED